MNERINTIVQRFIRNASKTEFLNLCSEIKEVLEKISTEKFEFRAVKDAWNAVDAPENLIVPWDEIDEEAQEDTLEILKGAKRDALRLYQNGLEELLATYENYENLDEFLGPILDREYTDLYTLAEWGA